MTKNEYDLACIEKSQQQFDELVKRSNHGEIVQCVKLLAMYIAFYKKHYGEITRENYMQMLETESSQADLSDIIQEAIEEASAMLDMIMTDRREELIHNEPPSSFIN